jgi:hypothetical protein
VRTFLSDEEFVALPSDDVPAVVAAGSVAREEAPRALGAPCKGPTVLQGEGGVELIVTVTVETSVVVVVKFRVAVRFRVVVEVTCGRVVVTTDVAVLVLVFVVSRGTTTRLLETSAAATMIAAAMYA